MSAKLSLLIMLLATKVNTQSHDVLLWAGGSLQAHLRDAQIL